MRQIFRLLLLCALLVSGSRAYSQNLLSNPETVIYDSAHHRYLVSNMSSGDIIAIDEYGSYTLLFDGLQGAYGMAIAGNTLYVSSYQGPTSGIVGIDLDNPAIVYLLPTTTSGENGITSDTSGNVYFADTGGNRIRGIRVSDGYSFHLAFINLPNAVFFDARNNRLLATSNVWWTPVYAVSLSSGQVTPATTLTGQFSGLAEDNLHNLYVAFFNYGRIYRLDSTLTGTPPPFLTGLSGPEGICFNKLHSILAIPNLLASRVDFMPIDIDVWCSAAPTSGWAPLDVAFSGSGIFEFSEWHWDFGDGQQGSGPSPQHTYTEPGYYDVTVQAITAASDTLRRVYPGMIVCLADTLRANTIELTEDDLLSPVEIVISVTNKAPLKHMVIPVNYGGELGLVYDSYTTAGCRTENFSSVQLVDQDPQTKRLLFDLEARPYGSPLYLSPGDGPILKIYFAPVGFLPGRSVPVGLAGYETTKPTLYGSSLTYQPGTVNGLVVYPCCEGRVGNANGLGTYPNEVTISDVQTLVTAKFIVGSCSILPCLTEADVNQSGGASPACKDVTIADIQTLVNHLFIAGPANAPLKECL